MIRPIFNILILFLALSLLSCNKIEGIDVNKLISTYSLESYGHYKNGKRQENKWFSKDSTLTFTLYENRKIDTCLLIVVNNKKDTLLKFLGNNINVFKSVLKKNDSYFLKFNNSYIDLNYNSVGNAKGRTDYFYIDSLKYYLIDTLTNKLTLIKRTSNDSLIAKAKEQFNLKGNFNFVIQPTNLNFVIAKDTTNGYQIYHNVSTKYHLEKKENQYELMPILAGSYRGKTKMGLYKDNISHNYYGLGYTLEDTIRGDGKIRKYSLSFKNHSIYRHPLEQYYEYNNPLIKTELYLHNNINNYDKRIKEFSRDNFKIQINGDNILEFRPDMFQYYSGDYFITTFLPYVDEYMEGYPPVYHLDTIQWKLNKVLPFNSKTDKKYTLLKKKGHVKLISGNPKKSVSYFLDSYEIVKTKNEYKLIKKD